MRTRMGIGIVIGLLVLGSAARAEPAPAEERLTPQPTAVVPAPCGQAAAGGQRRSLLEWLCYRPLSRPGLCGCCRQPSCCRPPLYFWFLDYCQAGSGTAYPLRLPSKCCDGCPSCGSRRTADRNE